MTKDVILTIVTPTYDRANLLPRLFESIKHQVQVGGDVEWLIIDDGSTDDTPNILAKFSLERPDLVSFVRVENGGKHRAITLSSRVARGSWILFVDSDDTLAPTAINELLEKLKSIEANGEIGMIRALRNFPELDISPEFRLSKNPSSYSAWVSQQRAFDCVEVIRRSTLMKYPFPDHPGENFMAEGWLWYSLDATHSTFFVNRTWVHCFYQSDGLSAQSQRNRALSPLNAIDVYRAVLSAQVSWKVRFRASINWWRYWFHGKRRYANFDAGRPAAPAFAPIGWILYRRDILN